MLRRQSCIRLCVILLSVLTFTDIAAAQTDSVTLSLDSCLRIALDTSPTLRVADLEVKRVDYSRRDVLAQLLPTVGFGATYNRMLAKQVAYMNMSRFPGMGGDPDSDGDGSTDSAKPATESKKGDSGIKMGLDNSFQLGFNATMPVIAPQLWQSLKLSDAQIAQAVEQSRASRLDLINNVKSAYYAYLLAVDARKVVQQSYDMAAITHRIYSDQFAAGAASEYDVLRTSVAMKNVEPEIVQADIAIKQARLQLLVLMGVDVTAPLKFAGTLSDYESDMYGDALSAGSDYSRNTSLVQNELQTRTLEQTLRVQRMAWYPTLALSASYNWTSSSDGSPFKNFRWNPYSMVGLTLSIPIFQGGTRYNAVKKAQIQLLQSQLTRQDLEHSVATQVDLARDNIMLNVKQIASCSQSVGQAEKAHDIMVRSFDIGAASYLDLRDSELALTRSRLAYFQAIYNYLIARSHLELLLGTAAD